MCYIGSNTLYVLLFLESMLLYLEHSWSIGPCNPGIPTYKWLVDPVLPNHLKKEGLGTKTTF